MTIYTAGAASTLLAGGSLGGVGATMSAGMTVLGGGAGFGAAALSSAAIGGAVGNIAGQGVAIASGLQDSFSWRQVGQSALGSAITAGVGSAVNAAGSGLGALQGSGAWASAGRAALSSGVNQALHGDWSWKQIVASAMGAGAGAAAGNALNGSALGNMTGPMGQRLAAGFVGGVVGQWAGPGGKANYGSVFASTLGNVVGDEISGSMASDRNPSNGNYRNGSDVQSDGPGRRYGFDDPMHPIDYSLAPAGSMRLNAASTAYGLVADDPAAQDLLPPHALMSRQDVEDRLRREIAGQEAREDSLADALFFRTAGASRGGTGPTSPGSPSRGGIGSGGFEMVRNGNWDAALNIGADPWGLLGEMPGVMDDLRVLDRIHAEERIDGLRQRMVNAGVKDVPTRYMESFVTDPDGMNRTVRNYGATLQEMQGIYEDHVRDQRMRGIWGDDYQNLRIGKSQMTPMEFEKRVLDIHMRATDKAYAAALDAIAEGKLEIKPGEYGKTVGSFIDPLVRDTLRGFARVEDINDSSMSSLWGINRRIKSAFAEGWGVPDSRLGYNLYADTTLARKNAYTPQIMKWNGIRPGNYLIIRPTDLGGPYVIPRASIPQQPKPNGKGL